MNNKISISDPSYYTQPLTPIEWPSPDLMSQVIDQVKRELIAKVLTEILKRPLTDEDFDDVSTEMVDGDLVFKICGIPYGTIETNNDSFSIHKPSVSFTFIPLTK